MALVAVCAFRRSLGTGKSLSFVRQPKESAMQTVALQDLITAVPDDQQSQAERFFERVFDSLMWTRVVGGKVEDVSPLKKWKQRQPSEVESDLAYLEINRSELLSTLSEYLSNPALRSKHADWLFLNVLTYAEYVATVSEVRKKVMGIERYVKSLHPPKSEHVTDISAYARRTWHLPVMLSVIAVSWAIHPFAGIATTAYALFVAYRQRKAWEKVNAVLASMLQTYLSFNTVDLSWAQVNSTLERSRGAGAVWDASLFALAEHRMEALNAKR